MIPATQILAGRSGLDFPLPLILIICAWLLGAMAVAWGSAELLERDETRRGR